MIAVALTLAPGARYAVLAQSIQSAATVSTTERQHAIALFDQRKFAEALDLLRAVVAKDKADHVAWYYLGFALIQEKKFKDASKAFETALKLRPKFSCRTFRPGLLISFKKQIIRCDSGSPGGAQDGPESG